MRYIAPIAIVGIIVVGCLIALLIYRMKDRQAGALAAARAEIGMQADQLRTATDALRTIRDLESGIDTVNTSLEASTALEDMERIRYTHNQRTQKELA